MMEFSHNDAKNELHSPGSIQVINLLLLCLARMFSAIRGWFYCLFIGRIMQKLLHGFLRTWAIYGANLDKSANPGILISGTGGPGGKGMCFLRAFNNWKLIKGIKKLAISDE